jgi:GNAT superfamily N-acetyltransferase
VNRRRATGWEEVPVFRSAVTVRDADLEDVEALRFVMAGSAGPIVDETPGEADSAVARIGADPDQRLLVALLDGQVVGAAHVVRAPVSPLQSAQAVHVLHLHVLDECRRRGVGTALMEATVSWAEEKDTAHVVAAANVGSRDANRFMARLGLSQLAVVRAAPVAALRAKLPVGAPAVCLDNRISNRQSTRTVGQVLARRRSLRRAQTKTS